MVHSLPVPGKKAGGVPVTVARLAEEMATRPGVEVSVGCIRGGGINGCRVWHPVGSGWLSRLCGSRLGVLFLYPLLLNFVRFPEADVMHFHGEDWFLLKRPCPVVRTMHGASRRERTFTRSQLRKILLTIAAGLERLSARMADRLLCVGTDTCRMFGSPHYIGNGFREELFRPGEMAPDPVVFYNGYWNGRKRGELAFRTFVEEVLPEFPGAKLRFLADQCPGHPSVIHHNGVTDEELAELYRRAWVFLYPSAYEGFGMPYVEAMASGTAVLCSPNPGASDVLREGRDGIIAEDADLGTELISLLQERSRRQRFEKAGLERARSFRIARVVDEHLQHYGELIEGTDAPAPAACRGGDKRVTHSGSAE